MTVAVLQAKSFLPTDHHLHVARAHYRQTSPSALHTHAGFAEVFWVERGRGVHLVNNQRVPLEPGDVVLVRRQDVHGFAAAGGGELAFVNVAFRDDVLADLRRRYFHNRPWPWSVEADLPLQTRLSPAACQRLSHWADAFSPAAQSVLERDGFLIDLLRLIADTQASRFVGVALPAWLGAALARQAASGDFSVPGLARATGRTREHINRIVRSCTGRTTTDVLNDMRMDEAARRLRMTADSITDIALDLGLSNLAHFYRLFSARLGTTPRRYRLRERTILP